MLTKKIKKPDAGAWFAFSAGRGAVPMAPLPGAGCIVFARKAFHFSTRNTRNAMKHADYLVFHFTPK